MYFALLVIAVTLLGEGCSSAIVNKHVLVDEIEKRIEANELPKKSFWKKRFVTITQAPDASYEHKPGDSILLVCNAIGSPAPTIRWFKNDVPVYEYEMESHEMIEINPKSIARISSTLIVSKTSGEDVYTCVATAGTKTAKTTTTVFSAGPDANKELTERAKLYPLIPRIVIWNSIYVDQIGHGIVLPCKAKGHPRPVVTWTDNNGDLIKNNPRMKVLRSGNLVISTLHWSDMGEFTCEAVNAFGSSIANTFVYPAKAG